MSEPDAPLSGDPAAGDAPAPRRGADLVGRHRGLGRRTVLISVLTLVSRVLGYVREVLSAALFGDRSAVFDAFITAWRVPNLFRRFLGEGAISTSFQTALTRAEGDHGEEAGRALFLGTLRVLLGLVIGVCLVVMGAVVLMPDRMPWTGWAWLGSDPAPVRELTLRVMPFVVLVCVAAFFGGALNVRGHFAAPAAAPVALNLGWIATLLVIAGSYGWSVDATDLEAHLGMTRVLAWGVLASGALQLAVQVPPLVRTGLLVRRPAPPIPADAPTPGTVLRRAAPLAFGAAVYQINVMVDGFMAEALLPDGGPTLHYYANRVQQFPMALLSVAATSAVFPALQALGHAGDREGLRGLHDRTQRAVAFLALPASVGLAVLATPIIAVSFERGAFGAEGVARASAALRMLALAILPAGATGLVARTYYSLGDFRTPVRVSTAMLIVNAALNLALIRGLGMDVDGLALATATTSWLGLALLLPGLSRRLELPRTHLPWARVALGVGLASGACGGAAWGTHLALQGHVGRGPALVGAIVAGAVAHLALSVALRDPELERLRKRFVRRR